MLWIARIWDSQSGASGDVSLLPPIRKPSVEVAGGPGREIHQQLHEVEMRVHVMSAAAAGQAGEDRCSSAAAWVADEEGVFAVKDHAVLRKNSIWLPSDRDVGTCFFGFPALENLRS